MSAKSYIYTERDGHIYEYVAPPRVPAAPCRILTSEEMSLIVANELLPALHRRLGVIGATIDDDDDYDNDDDGYYYYDDDE